MFESIKLDIKWDVVIVTIILGVILFILSFNIMNKVNSPYIDIGIGKDAYISLMNILASLFIAFVLGYRLSLFLINLWHRLTEKPSKKK